MGVLRPLFFCRWRLQRQQTARIWPEKSLTSSHDLHPSNPQQSDRDVTEDAHPLLGPALRGRYNR
jgi:hypothetical protein